MNTTKYYEEFLRYTEMAAWQQANCKLGTTNYDQTPFDDDLMKSVDLYDMVNRKMASFSYILMDSFYEEEDHPFKHKSSEKRKEIIKMFSCARKYWTIEEYLFVFFVHRLTGSGINYAVKPSGYFNSIILKFGEAKTIDDMVEILKNNEGPMFTSRGYQIAAFPKPVGEYKKGGIYFMSEILPNLIREFAEYTMQGKKSFRVLMDWLSNYNQSKGCRRFIFQYSAALADLADFYPHLVDLESHFFYGTNAVECLSYLAIKPKGVKKIDHLDNIMEMIQKDTGYIPYDAEDIACDAIRYIENYVNPMGYPNVDLDQIWNSSEILDHPFGRQKKMIELNLVQTFNNGQCPTHNMVIKRNNLSVEDYKGLCNKY
jgi:hypothetical protein